MAGLKTSCTISQYPYSYLLDAGRDRSSTISIATQELVPSYRKDNMVLHSPLGYIIDIQRQAACSKTGHLFVIRSDSLRHPK